MGRLGIVLAAALLGVWLGACGGRSQQAEDVDEAAWAAAVGQADTVGVRDLAQGDTTSDQGGLVAIQLSRGFGEGQVVAWEIQACELTPVKLIVVRLDRDEGRFELLGESPTVVPRHLGANRFVLPEPIPVQRRCFAGLVFPEKPSVPFAQVLNWQTFITTKPLQRPFMDRRLFAAYGWRFSMRVLWHPAARAAEQGTAAPATGTTGGQ